MLTIIRFVGHLHDRADQFTADVCMAEPDISGRPTCSAGTESCLMTHCRKISRLLGGLLLVVASAYPACAQTSGNDTENVTGKQAIASAAQNDQFSFVMFYRTLDAATKDMRQVISSTLAGRSDSQVVSVQISDPSESELVKQFDATRIPLPAVAVIAPNGAICRVLPMQVTSQQLIACIVSQAQANCLKALQDNQIVALCVQPTSQAEIPIAVRQLQNDRLYHDRIQIVSVLANDPQETTFLNQLRVPTDRLTPMIALMAPPGVMVGIFDSSVTYAEMTQKMVAAGKCCDDPNCKHRQSAGVKQTMRR